MAIFEIVTGNESFPTASAKMHVFVCRRGYQETHIGSAARGGLDGLSPIGRPSKEQASPGRRDDLGYWLTHRVEILDGTILKIFGSVQRGNGAIKMMGTAYIQVREGAALRRMSMNLTRHAWSGRQSAHVEGEFDPVDPGRLASLGINVDEKYLRFSTPEQYGRVFALEELRAETVAMVAVDVAVAGGDVTTVNIVRPLRRINLRRGG